MLFEILQNFDPSTGKSQKLMLRLRKYRGVISDVTKIDKKFEGKLTCASKNDLANLAIFIRGPESLKIGT